MRLGEFLVKQGVINWNQLEQVLSDQLLNGGHLGTCLIEGGYVNEATLGRALAECSGNNYASTECFDKIPQKVLNALPAKLVIRHSAIPFRMNERELDVAMINPNNLEAIDELAFATSHTIRPWIAPEIRIFQALENHYDVPRRRRYVSLCAQLDHNDPTSESEFSEMIVRPENDWGRTSGSRNAIEGDPNPVSNLRPLRSPAARPEPDADVTESLDKTGDRLCECEDAEGLADTVLEYVARRAERAVLFRMHKGLATIWRTHGLDIDPATTESLCLPLVSEPLFLLMRGEDHFCGPLPADMEFGSFYESIAAEKPAEVLILPVYMNDRVVALLYADGGPRGIVKGAIEEYRRLARKLALALQVMLLREQIKVV